MSKCGAAATGAMVAALALAGCAGSTSDQDTSSDANEVDSGETAQAATPSIHGFTMTRIDGTPEPLSAYEGKVVLVVNTASKCGLTPQYEGLERLYETKSGDGFVVLGFPANNFMGQEPGTNTEIAQFCSANYGVTFPMFEKISVKGADQHELFRMLSEETEEPSWNFTKYLVDQDGRVVRRFGPRTKPEDAELVAEVDRLLGAG